MRDAEREEVIVVGWLRGEDYEAAVAYRRRERSNDKHEGKPAKKHQTSATPSAGRSRGAPRAPES
jgi:hypothetical protein